ncbi:DUF3168 domain-containing protein [Ponticaulis koreensis]|uniref:DUF3168 domain-containing protein n=1 Tax=Ponticaulis koreensis TaxID=1123045 RepID=UPI0003B3C282|nr:DUF3168 domain-containing protein [Ponticaulis koreensis]
MSHAKPLEDEVIRALAEAGDIQESFGTPARILNGEEGRAAFPFLRLARHEIRDDGQLSDHRLSLEIYSRSGGRAEANRLIALVADALRAAELSPEGQSLVVFYPVFSDVFLRADGTTFRGLLRLRAITDEA